MARQANRRKDAGQEKGAHSAEDPDGSEGPGGSGGTESAEAPGPGAGSDNRFREAKSASLRLLAVRPRTRADLAKALARKGFDDEVTGEVLDRLERARLIDDAEYAEMVVRSRYTHQGLGRKGLKSELVRQGVAAEIAEDAVSTIGPADEEERARELVRKRVRGMARLDDKAVVRRLVGMLARKGYSEGLAYRVVRQELASVGRDAESLDGVTEEL